MMSCKISSFKYLNENLPFQRSTTRQQETIQWNGNTDIAHAYYVCAGYYSSHTTHWMDSLKSSEINLARWHGQEMGPWT
jgi:hypothetical protein